ncbi:HEXXH motif-containing putative peptide modification protein, partial [Paenibacillus sp. JX-17]
TRPLVCFHFISYEGVYRLHFYRSTPNVDSVIDFYYGEGFSDTLSNDSKKTNYFEALNAIQKTKIPSNSEKVEVTFDNRNLCDLLLENHMIDAEDLEGDKHLFLNEERDQILYNISKALELIKILHEDLYKLFNQLIGSIYLIKKDGFGGGSVSGLIGLIWLNPLKEWTVIDYAEALCHEFIHNSLFLDDMVNSVFPDPYACASDEALTTSTILKIKRPLDRSYHAANVSIGIMHLYYMLHDKNKSYMYKDDLANTISEINERQKFLGDQGLLIFNEMKNFLTYFDFESITLSLRGEL